MISSIIFHHAISYCACCALDGSCCLLAQGYFADGCNSPVEERSKLIALAIWLPEQMAARHANVFLPHIFDLDTRYQWKKERQTRPQRLEAKK